MAPKTTASSAPMHTQPSASLHCIFSPSSRYLSITACRAKKPGAESPVTFKLLVVEPFTRDLVASASGRLASSSLVCDLCCTNVFASADRSPPRASSLSSSDMRHSHTDCVWKLKPRRVKYGARSSREPLYAASPRSSRTTSSHCCTIPHRISEIVTMTVVLWRCAKLLSSAATPLEGFSQMITPGFVTRSIATARRYLDSASNTPAFSFCTSTRPHSTIVSSITSARAQGLAMRISAENMTFCRTVKWSTMSPVWTYETTPRGIFSGCTVPVEGFNDPISTSINASPPLFSDGHTTPVTQPERKCRVSSFSPDVASADCTVTFVSVRATLRGVGSFTIVSCISKSI
eukprot:PhM_4_TR8270/c0_g1_i1/m.53456